jgi:hypothetical protein
MIGMILKARAKKHKDETGKKTKFAGIRFRDQKKIFMKTKSAQTTQFRMGWDCTVLCLLHSGPRIYTGPL